MEIKFNSDTSSVARATGPVVKPTQAAPADLPVTFDNSEALNQALAATPESRPTEVGRIQSAFVTENYPPLEVMRKIAALLAVSLDSQD